VTAAALVRPARAQDLDDLLALFRCLNRDDAILPAADAARIWAEMAATPGLTALVAEGEGRAVAMCTLIVVPNLGRGGRPFAIIESVATLPDVRRRGFGRAVIEAALERAWAQDCYKVMLTTGSGRPDVLAFYATLGFSEGDKTALQIRRV
jgi:GNAT superfamily N-acetyltransferase